MAKLPGLFQREGVYQLRVIIPKGVQSAYGGTKKRVESLGTSDYQTAKVVATALRATRLAEAQRMTAAVRRNDETLRSDPAIAALLLNTIEEALPPSPLLMGIGPLAHPLPPPKTRWRASQRIWRSGSRSSTREWTSKRPFTCRSSESRPSFR